MSFSVIRSSSVPYILVNIDIRPRNVTFTGNEFSKGILKSELESKQDSGAAKV